MEGGESVVLDLFPVVEELRDKFPEHFQTLVRVPAVFQKIHYDRYVCQSTVWGRDFPQAVVLCLMNSNVFMSHILYVVEFSAQCSWLGLRIE